MKSIKHILYKIKWLYAPKFHYVTNFPTCINIEPTNACNLKCVMCFNNSCDMPKGFMDIDLYKKIIDECKRFKLDSVKLSWRGEPLLHKKIVEMIKYAKDSGIYEVSINTNALLLNEKKIKEIVDTNLDFLLISIDGADKKTYEKIRRGGNYEILEKNINELVKARNEKHLKFPKIILHAVKMKENKSSIENLYKKYSDIVDDIYISDETPLYGLDRDRFYEKDFENIIRKPCDQLWQRLSISWNGDVAMCCNDWVPKIILGNVRSESIRDIWHGEKINHIRDLHKQFRFEEIDMCSKCVCLESCEKK